MSAADSVLVEYLATSRIGEKGQLTIPKEYRDEMGLSTGAPVSILRIGDGLILIPEQERFNQLCEKISTKLEGAGITEIDLQATLKQTRQRMFDRKYPKLAQKESKREARKR